MTEENIRSKITLVLVSIIATAVVGFIFARYEGWLDTGELHSDVAYQIETPSMGRSKLLMNVQLTNNTDETITTTEIRFRLRSEGKVLQDAAQTAAMTISEELNVILPNVTPGQTMEIREEFRHEMKAGDDDWSRWTIHPPRGVQWKGTMTVQPVLVHNGGELLLSPFDLPIEPWKPQDGMILNLPDDPEAMIESITKGNGVVEM